jgi:hypothetical protein
MSWYCESGCMEKRTGDTVFGMDDRDWDLLRQSQGVPSNWISGVHVAGCSVCANLFETWLRAQKFWPEYIVLRAKETRLKGELKAGRRDAGEVERELAEHESVTMEAWVTRARPVIQAWWDARKAEVGVENAKIRADARARREAEKAAKVEKK